MDRAEQELDILEQISQILGDGLELGQIFQRVMLLLGDRLNIQRASLVLWDDTIGQARIVAGFGLTNEEISRGRYALGEGITGKVMGSGQPQVLADISKVQGFLNRTGSRSIGSGKETAPSYQPPLSFICVPIKSGDRIVGTMSVDKPFVDEPTLYADARLITIIAGSIAQTIRVHQLMQVEKDQWLAENQALRETLRSKYRFDNIIGSSRAMLDVLSTIGQVAGSRATTLLLGELQLAPQRQNHDPRQLRRALSSTSRIRTLRTRQRRVHRRHQGQDRPL
jgi:Nif-specific regulatory protein